MIATSVKNLSCCSPIDMRLRRGNGKSGVDESVGGKEYLWNKHKWQGRDNSHFVLARVSRVISYLDCDPPKPLPYPRSRPGPPLSSGSTIECFRCHRYATAPDLRGTNFMRSI